MSPIWRRRARAAGRVSELPETLYVPRLGDGILSFGFPNEAGVMDKALVTAFTSSEMCSDYLAKKASVSRSGLPAKVEPMSVHALADYVNGLDGVMLDPSTDGGGTTLSAKELRRRITSSR